jgi:LmbE family N-acetylglucosaminyl deacetylase
LTTENVKALLTNAQYPTLNPLCNDISAMLICAKALATDGCGAIFTPEATKRAMTVRDHGFKTVSLTWTVFKVMVDVPKVAGPAQKRDAIAAVRTALAAKHFCPPEPLEARMKALEEGKI